ncbi:MAG: 6-phosphogluconolactonase [Burkholderiales bacterium]
MKIEVLPDAEAVSRRGAEFIARLAKDAVDERERFVMAVSGGNTPWQMFRNMATMDVPWKNIHVVQVDERVAPLGDSDRNLTQLQSSLLAHVPLPAQQIHLMQVEEADLNAAAVRYAGLLEQIAGSPPVLDLVELGLGLDGHTASLIPDDLALEAKGADVTVTSKYQGRRRMTLTYPIINRARCILWVVTGSAKAEVLARLALGDATMPAGRVNRERAFLLADREAAAYALSE